MDFINRLIANIGGGSTVAIGGGVSLTNVGLGANYVHPTGYLWGNPYTGSETIDGDLTSNGKITAKDGWFYGGLQVDNDITVGGDVHVAGEIGAESGVFKDVTVNNNLSAKDAMIESATIQDLFVSGRAHFIELIIDKINSTNGNLILSPAHCTISRVEVGSADDDEEDYLYCYFKAKDDDHEISNDFEIGDLVITQSFNINEGASENAQNKFVWKRVIGTSGDTPNENGEHFFIVQRTGAEGNPNYAAQLNIGDFEAGDVACVLGNVSDRTRQKAIYIASVDNAWLGMGYSQGTAIYPIKAPAIVTLDNINSYTLLDKHVSVISPTYNLLSANSIAGLDSAVTRIITEDEITSDFINEILDELLSGTNFDDLLLSSSEYKQTKDAITLSVNSIESLKDQMTEANRKITVNANAINITRQAVNLKASQASLDELSGRVTKNEGDITVMAGQIDLTVKKDDLETAGIHLDGENSKITANANNFEIVNNKGEQTVFVDENGNIVTTGNGSFKGKIEANGGSFKNENDSFAVELTNDGKFFEIDGVPQFDTVSGNPIPADKIPYAKVGVTDYYTATSGSRGNKAGEIQLFTPQYTNNGATLQGTRKVTLDAANGLRVFNIGSTDPTVSIGIGGIVSQTPYVILKNLPNVGTAYDENTYDPIVDRNSTEYRNLVSGQLYTWYNPKLGGTMLMIK